MKYSQKVKTYSQQNKLRVIKISGKGRLGTIIYETGYHKNRPIPWRLSNRPYNPHLSPIPRVATIANCLTCNQEFLSVSNSIVCSNSCAGRLPYDHGTKRYPEDSPKPIDSNTECTLCHKPIHRWPAKLKRSKTHYCSREHQHQAMSGPKRRPRRNPIRTELSNESEAIALRNKRHKLDFWQRAVERAKHNTRTRNNIRYPCDLTPEFLRDLFKKQGGMCALAPGLWKLSTTSKSSFRQATLDRIDSTKGYTRDNIQWACKALNVAKLDSTQEQWMKFINEICGTNTK